MTDFLGRLREDLRLQTIVLIIMGILAAVSLVQGCKNAVLVSQDFQWDAAKVLTLHINPYDESLSPSGILEPYGFEKYYLQMEANQFPSLLWLLLPYTFLPPLAARYAWLISNLLFTVGIIFLLRRTFLCGPAGSLTVRKTAFLAGEKDGAFTETGPDNFAFAFFMLLMIAGTPWRNQIGVGQHTLFSFFFFLTAVYLAKRQEGISPETGSRRAETGQKNTGSAPERRLFSLGAALALSVCYFKYTLTVPLTLCFIYKRRYKEIIVSVIPHILLTAFSAWWLKDSFLNMIIKPLKVSVRLLGEGGLDLGSLFPKAGINAVVVLIFLYLLYYALRLSSVSGNKNTEAPEREERAEHQEKNGPVRQKDPSEYTGALLISVLTLWSLIMTYHRTYDFFVIVVVLAFMYRPECPKHLRYLYAAVLIGVFFVLRVFSESMPSKYAVGAVYYIFTILVTVEGELIRRRTVL